MSPLTSTSMLMRFLGMANQLGKLFQTLLKSRGYFENYCQNRATGVGYLHSLKDLI